jgi:hypothetical protein
MRAIVQFLFLCFSLTPLDVLAQVQDNTKTVTVPLSNYEQAASSYKRKSAEGILALAKAFLDEPIERQKAFGDGEYKRLLNFADRLKTTLPLVPKEINPDLFLHEIRLEEQNKAFCPELPPEKGWACQVFSNADSERYYPIRAIKSAINGHATVQCRIVDGRPRHCLILSESNPSFEFGIAAIRMCEAREPLADIYLMSQVFHNKKKSFYVQFVMED